MKIKKLGHCCLIIKEAGRKIMTDPGSYTIDEQIKETDIDIILITHEHSDHLHIESLKKVLEANSNATVITNARVGKLLDEANIKYQILPEKTATEIFGVELEAHNCKHEEIFEELGQVQNTGYFISKRLFYPGDAFYNPGKRVEILALPVAGPWSRVRDFMKYVLDVKPKICFPVHDGMLGDSFKTAYWVPELILPKLGIEFRTLENKVEEEF